MIESFCSQRSSRRKRLRRIFKNNDMQTSMANIIEGSPTKQFFIDMITRDISIEDAIIDLLDNSIDGANRLATAAGKKDFKGLNLHVKLSLSEAGLSIEDNCGGFLLETAKKYAFRFGRPSDAPHHRLSGDTEIHDVASGHPLQGTGGSYLRGCSVRSI